MTDKDDNFPAIRIARLEDAETLSHLSRQLLLYEKSLNETMGELTAWAASVVEMRKQILRPANKFFVAEKQGQVVGYLKLTLYGLNPTRNELGTLRWLMDRMERVARNSFNLLFGRPRPNVETAGGYIAGIFVHAEARKTNVGRLLVTAAENWLRSNGINSAELHVLYVNEDARRFWESMGYAPLTLGMRKKF